MNIIFNESNNILGGVETFLFDLATLLSPNHNVYFLVNGHESYYEVNDVKNRFNFIYKNSNVTVDYMTKRAVRLEKKFVSSQLDLDKKYTIISLYFWTFQYALAMFGDQKNFKLLHFWPHPQQWVNELFFMRSVDYIITNNVKNKKKYVYQKNLLISLNEKFADYCGLNHAVINYNNWFYGIQLSFNPNSFAFPVLSKCSQSNRHFDIQDSKKLKILWLGRFDFQKKDAIEYILDTLDYLTTRFLDYKIEFTIVGSGEKKYEESIIKKVNSLKFKPNLLGKVEYETLPQLFLQYDIGIGMGLSVKNMADCSLPAILIDSINHSDINKPACNWLFDSEIDDAGDGYYHFIAGTVVYNKTLIELLDPILENKIDLSAVSRKSKEFFDNHYSMENSLNYFFKLINESKFNGTGYKIYSRPLIIKILYILYKKSPKWIRLYIRFIVSKILLYTYRLKDFLLLGKN